MDYSKFDKTVDLEGLKQDMRNAAEKNREYDEIPLGTYEVSIEKLELGETGPDSKVPGSPMVKIQFRIVEGEYTNFCLFMNQVITQGFQLHIMNDFLRSLASGVVVEFEDYTQYAAMLDEIFEAINGKKEFAIEYGMRRNFKTFTVTNIFELE